jgi:hypothetical protein
MASIGGSHIDSTLMLNAPCAGPDDGRALELLATVGGEFGLIHRFDDREAERAAATGP